MISKLPSGVVPTSDLLKIRQILAKVLFGSNSLDENLLTRTNSEWDSLKHLQIVLELEDCFDLEFLEGETEDFYDAENILQTIIIIRAKREMP